MQIERSRVQTRVVQRNFSIWINSSDDPICAGKGLIGLRPSTSYIDGCRRSETSMVYTVHDDPIEVTGYVR